MCQRLATSSNKKKKYRIRLSIKPRTNLDLGALFQDTAEDGTTSYAASEIHHLLTRLVDIEGADDDHPGVRGEVAPAARRVFIFKI